MINRRGAKVGQEGEDGVQVLCVPCVKAREVARKMMNDLFVGTQSANVLSHACRVMIVTVKCEQAVQTNCGTTVRVQMWHVRGVSVYTSPRRLPGK